MKVEPGRGEEMNLLLFFALLNAALTFISASGPGGVEKIKDLESDEVQAAARAAVSQLNKLSNSEFKTVLVKVTEGSVQIVAGKKYILTFTAGISTLCKKDDDATENCPVSRNTLATWNAAIVHHPWYSPEYEIVSLEQANEQAHHSHKMGGPVPVEDVQDPDVLAAADVAVTELNKRSNSLYKMVLMEVLEGTVQVVSGVKYTLTLQVGMSKCRNDGSTATSEQCPVQFDMNETWQAVVLQHPTVPPQYDLLTLDKLL